MSKRRKLGSHLELHNGSIRVVVSVPVALQRYIGKTKLKEALDTDSPSVAELRKWPVIARLKAELSGAARVAGSPLFSDAMEWRTAMGQARRPDGPVDDAGDEYGLVSVLLSERAEEIERAQGSAAATAFVGIATGTATPLTAHLETFLAETRYSPRYKGDIRRAVGRLVAWTGRTGAGETVEAVSKKVAGQFVSQELATILNDRKTINKDVSALSSYWRWLGKRGHIGDDARNPWEKQGHEVSRSAGLAGGGKAREFTSAEAEALLYGPATPRMKDIMWIAALSGMRIDEVCRLQVRDCASGSFAANARRSETGEGKTEASRRDIPIHSTLTSIIAARTMGKAQEALLIDGLPARDPKGVRNPSGAAVQEFNRYRKRMGVDEVVAGQRRGRVTFHSWRRWFVTEAERAGQPPHIISTVVGHSEGRKGMTLGTYSGGPSEGQRRAVVESVQPPPKKTPADQV